MKKLIDRFFEMYGLLWGTLLILLFMIPVGIIGYSIFTKHWLMAILISAIMAILIFVMMKEESVKQ